MRRQSTRNAYRARRRQVGRLVDSHRLGRLVDRPVCVGALSARVGVAQRRLPAHPPRTVRSLGATGAATGAGVGSSLGLDGADVITGLGGGGAASTTGVSIFGRDWRRKHCQLNDTRCKNNHRRRCDAWHRVAGDERRQKPQNATKRNTSRRTFQARARCRSARATHWTRQWRCSKARGGESATRQNAHAAPVGRRSQDDHRFDRHRVARLEQIKERRIETADVRHCAQELYRLVLDGRFGRLQTATSAVPRRQRTATNLTRATNFVGAQDKVAEIKRLEALALAEQMNDRHGRPERAVAKDLRAPALSQRRQRRDARRAPRSWRLRPAFACKR